MTTMYLRGQPVRLNCQCVNEAGTPVAPATLTLEVQEPGGTVVNYSLASSNIPADSAGNYHVDFIPTLAGRHFYRWESTTPAGAAEGQFRVCQGAFTN